MNIERWSEAEWFRIGYDLYSFEDAASFRALKTAAFDGVEVLAFIGEWCGDTHDQLPGVVRILDTVGFPRARLRVYSLDRSKRLPEGSEGETLLARFKVERVPTFVWLRDGVEIGRITETPEVSLIADLAGMARA